MTYNPDNWVIIKVKSDDPHYRVLAGWSSGYTTGVNLEHSLLALRFCFGFGSLLGIWFTLFEEGREFAEEFAGD